MAKINDGVLKDWSNGDKFTAEGYEADREILRTANNDTDSKVESAKANIQTHEQRIDDLEYNVTGTVVPMTFKNLGMQNLTFDDIKLGYIDSKMDEALENVLDQVPRGITEEFTATEGQVTFTLVNPYIPNTSQLSIEVDGVPQEGSYTEVDAHTITFSEGLPAGALVSISISELKPTNDERFNVFSYKLDGISVYVMPEPDLDKAVNTQNFNDISIKALDSDVPIEIRFRPGTYEIQTLFVFNNTKVVLHDDTVLNFTAGKFLNPETNALATVSSVFMNARPYNPVDSNITGYNGHGNITIEGGTVYGGCFMTMIHGYNITVRNVRIKDATADHCFQVNSSKNVLIEGCEFNGVPVQDVSRNYVEMIQLDYCTSGGVPGWVSTAAIYDHTMCDGVTIRNCSFGKSLDPTKLQTIYTAIGSHSSDGGRKNKNILIEGCKFADTTYANISVREMENVTIRNNELSSTDINGNLVHIDGSSNVNVYGNRFNGGRRAVYANDAKGVHINDNEILGGWSYQVFTTEGVENLNIVNNNFRDFTFGSTSANAVIALRSAKKFFVHGNTAKNVLLSNLNSSGAAQDTMFVFVYATSGDTSNDGYIGKNIIDDYTKIKLDSKVTYSSSVNVKALSHFSGLTWVSGGDSITAGSATYGYYQEHALPILTNVSTHYNRGYSGYSMTKYTNTATGSSIQDVTSQFEVADVYTIFLGTNDFSRNAPIGSNADAAGKLDSFWGGMKKVYADLLAKNPNAIVIFITPLKRTASPAWNVANTAGVTLSAYVQAIKDFASEKGCPVIDLFNISGVNSDNAATFLYDGLHPNKSGNPRVGKIIGRQMNSLI